MQGFRPSPPVLIQSIHDILHSLSSELAIFSVRLSIDSATLAQFFSHNSSPASRQVCRPGAEQADKFMF
jgi:hypothetical protein